MKIAVIENSETILNDFVLELEKYENFDEVDLEDCLDRVETLVENLFSLKRKELKINEKLLEF